MQIIHVGSTPHTKAAVHVRLLIYSNLPCSRTLIYIEQIGLTHSGTHDYSCEPRRLALSRYCSALLSIHNTQLSIMPARAILPVDTQGRLLLHGTHD